MNQRNKMVLESAFARGVFGVNPTMMCALYIRLFLDAFIDGIQLKYLIGVVTKQIKKMVQKQLIVNMK